MNLRQLFVIAGLYFCCFLPSHAQSGVFHGKKIRVPVIPPADQKIRLIIVSDATNEIDDVWAISLALLYPERFDVLGFVGSNYDMDYNFDKTNGKILRCVFVDRDKNFELFYNGLARHGKLSDN